MNSSTTLTPLLTARDVAARLQVSEDTVYVWIAERGLPVVRIGRTVPINPATLDRWLAEQEAARA